MCNIDEMITIIEQIAFDLDNGKELLKYSEALWDTASELKELKESFDIADKKDWCECMNEPEVHHTVINQCSTTQELVNECARMASILEEVTHEKDRLEKELLLSQTNLDLVEARLRAISTMADIN